MVDPRRVIKLFADDTRLRLIRVLADQEFAVSELVEILGQPQSKISRHLGVLREAGVLADRSEGTWTYYRLDRSGMGELPRRVWQTLGDYLSSADSEFYPDDARRAGQVLEARKRRVRAYFDQVGPGWKAVRDSYLPRDIWARTLACLLDGSLTVAEVGVGAGEMVVLLARAVRRVIAVDISPKMLAGLDAQLRAAGLDNVALIEGDAGDLPIESGACDAVFASMVLHHVEKPAAAMAELARVARPGGKVVICELARHRHDWVREAMADLWLGFDAEQALGWMRDAGLASARCETLPGDAPSAGGEPVKFETFIVCGVKP